MNLGQELPAELVDYVENIQHEIADLPGASTTSPSGFEQASGILSSQGTPVVPLILTLIVAMIVIR